MALAACEPDSARRRWGVTELGWFQRLGSAGESET